MANNYQQSSSFINIPQDQLEQARQIVAEVESALEDREGVVGFTAEVEEEGVWVHSEEWFDTDAAHELFTALVDTLDLPGQHLCSWAYTCSKPRIDEFGGGAFVVQKGKPTVWVDAVSTAIQLASLGQKTE